MSKNSIDAVVRFEETTQALAASGSAREFCEKLVHNARLGEFIHSAAIYRFDGKQTLHIHDSYGKDSAELSVTIDLWGDDLRAQAVRSRAPETISATAPKGYVHRTIPIAQDGAPTGLLLLTVTENYEWDKTDNEIGVTIGMLLTKMLELWNASGNKNGKRVESLSIEDLTSRQIRILNLIAEGMTNAEISRQVLLSESSVRQETIKIYRALGVSGRREAMLRGRDLGLVPSIEDIQNEQLAPIPPAL